MKKLCIVLILFISSQISYGQITQEEIFKLNKIPKTYQLDILDQKLEGNTFKTVKHKRYFVELVDDLINQQKIYDTIHKKVVVNRTINYTYNKNNLIKKMTFYDFNNQLKKKILFDYDIENKLLFETIFSENTTTPTTKISYNYEKCNLLYISDLISDEEVKNIDETYYCVKKTTHKLQSNYIIKNVLVNKSWIGLAKKIDLKSDKNETINRFYTYNYDENNNVIRVNLTKNSTTKTFKTNEYNTNNLLIKTKSGYSEFYYTYKYDEHKNWIERIETSKVASKRTIYKQTFKY